MRDKLVYLLLAFSATFCAIESSFAETISDDAISEIVPAILDLNPVRSRIDRQFKDLENGSGSGDSSVAMSLVDALQRWADALEAQVSQSIVKLLNSLNT